MGIVKNYSKNKGQVTFVNLLALFITIIIYLMLYPVIDTMVEGVVAGMSETEYTPLISTVLRIMPAIIGLAIMITALNYANPPRY